MDGHFVGERVRCFLRPLFGVVLRLLNPFRPDPIIREFLAADMVNVLHQRRMAKRGWTQSRYVRLKCTTLENFSFCRRPLIESHAVSQLFKTRPKSDGSYQ